MVRRDPKSGEMVGGRVAFALSLHAFQRAFRLRKKKRKKKRKGRRGDEQPDSLTVMVKYGVPVIAEPNKWRFDAQEEMARIEGRGAADA